MHSLTYTHMRAHNGKGQRAPTHSNGGHSHIGTRSTYRSRCRWLDFIFDSRKAPYEPEFHGFKDFLCSHCLNGMRSVGDGEMVVVRWHGCSNLHLTQFRGTQKTFAAEQPPEHAAPPRKPPHPHPHPNPNPLLWANFFSLPANYAPLLFSPSKRVERARATPRAVPRGIN